MENEHVELTEKAHRMLDDVKITPPELRIAEDRPPEVISKEILKQRLDGFQRSFVIEKNGLLFKTVKITNTPFEAVSYEEQNMAIGVRVTAVLSKEGENLINPEAVGSRDDVGAYAVNHEDGYAGFMACMQITVPLKNKEDCEKVSFVEGEVYTQYTAGYDVLPINREAVGQEVKFEELTFTISQYEKNYIQLTCSPKDQATYLIEAYTDKGERIAHDWVRYPVFKGGKLATEFSPDAIPKSKDIIEYVYTFIFYGAIDKAELYIQKIEEAHWLPFKTPEIVDPFNWDDFKKIGAGPSYFSPETRFQSLPDEEIENSIRCKFTRSDALLELNEAEITVILPKTHNMALGSFHFKNVTIEIQDGKFEELSFDRSAKCITGFCRKGTGDEVLEIKPGETRFKGEVGVRYPAEIEWVRFSKDKLEHEGHKVEFDGGFLLYKKPVGYVPVKFNEKVAGYVVRCFDANGNRLSILRISYIGQERSWKVDDSGDVGVGVWGASIMLKLRCAIDG